MRNIEWLRNELGKIFIPMPPETYVQYYIDNDLLPSNTMKGFQGTWSKEDPYKVCPYCKDNLHITKYHVRRGRTDRRGWLCIASLCMECQSKKYELGGKPVKKTWSGNAEKRGKAAKAAIMEYFGNVCMRCGYEGQAAQMDLDHLNPKEKLYSLTTGFLTHSTPEDIIEEVLKCQLVCANCHRLISSKAKHQKDTLTYLSVGNEVFGSKGILERMSAPAPDREYLRSDS